MNCRCIKPTIDHLKLRIIPFDALNQKSKPQIDLSLAQLFSETGYCFVHIPKNGGSSVEKLVYKNHSVKHRKWHEFHAMSPMKYQTWIKFCVIRNPFERFLSAYDYLKKGGRNPVDAEIGRRFVRSTKDANEFIHKFSDAPFRRRIMSYFHFQTQAEYVLSHDDICMVNRLLSFENFDQELADFLGLEASDILHVNKTSGHRTTFEDLDDTSKSLIREYYSRDFILYEALSHKGEDLYQKKLSDL